MSLIETRQAQMFPVLDAAQIETARRFASGPARDFAPGELIYDVGQLDVPAWLLLEGAIELTRHDVLGPVEIGDSLVGVIVIQAPFGVCDGSLGFDGCAVDEDGAALPGQGDRPWAHGW